MPSLFFRQFGALFRKNWIVLAKHPILNILRCFILPIAYGIFLAVAQTFLVKQNNYGLGSATPVPRLVDEFDGSLALIWADATQGIGVPTPDDIMSVITTGFTVSQMRAVKKLDDPEEIPLRCPQNYNALSECYAAIVFERIPLPEDPSGFRYTIRADIGLYYINVIRHTSDFEKRILPLQWAVDQAIIKLRTGSQIPTPLEWPFTQQTNEEQATAMRLSYIRGLRTLLVLALFIAYIGVAYQLPGAFSGERANLLTSHMKAMGLLDSARMISWQMSISLAYFPAWIIVAIIWRYRIFTATSVPLILAVHLLFGLSLASWSFFVAVPFGKSPQLAAILSTFLAILFAVFALVLGKAKSGWACIFTIIFPPSFYVFAIRAICGFENHQIPTNALLRDPDNNLRLLPLMIVAMVNIILWPCLAVLLERKLYDARDPSGSSWICWKRTKDENLSMSPDIAISIRNLQKTFSTSIFRRDNLVTAISDLSFDVPKFGIFVLLGSNGAGKSTVLSILGGLIGRTRGSVSFEGGIAKPPRGTIGIVPQKNVLFPELSCYQTLRVWRAVKWSSSSAEDEDLQQLLRDCDLENKIHANANTLSGGQKRKLQLAIGLTGGSKIVLVDEGTSGIDPLSRRALWRTLTSFRNERTIVFTTHFLDEADLLADNIAVLAIPGKLVAEGSPVTLKRDLGTGYNVQVTYTSSSDNEQVPPHDELLQRIRTIAPDTHISTSAAHKVSYQLNSKDSATVERVLRLIDSEKENLGIASCDIHGASIEEIFLDLMNQSDKPDPSEKGLPQNSSSDSPTLDMNDGRRRTLLSQAFTIFYKRALIARRSWLAPLLTIVIAVTGSCVPLFFMADRVQSCTKRFIEPLSVPLFFPRFLPEIYDPKPPLLASPPNITSSLGYSTSSLVVNNVADNATFVSTIDRTYHDLALGGISIDLQTGSSLVAWEATPPGFIGPAMLNLATNILFNHALNSSGDNITLIEAYYESFPRVSGGTLFALKWAGFFGLAMSVFPAFYALYVAKERHSSVQAMQFSNGLSNPAGLWMGHLLFDSVFTVTLASIICIVFGTASNQFHGLGIFWIVLVLYGIVGALFSYCVSIVFISPLAAFAAVAGYQVVMFMLYVAGYLLALTYAKTSSAKHLITIIHFTLSVLSPVANIMRACLVSVNLFSLLCMGDVPITASALGKITTYGGPIAYLFVYGFILFAILVWVDSGSTLPRLSKLQHPAVTNDSSSGQFRQDVAEEAQSVANSSDLLRVLQVTKAFGRNTVVEDVSFGVSRDTVFAMLGPNGAGKTTTFNIIRGDIVPDAGDVLINGVSVINHPTTARLALGVCPQFTAIDSQLTVREHLAIYGRLKGLRRGNELNHNIDSLLQATTLNVYADRLASKLSGGNQRKLSLAIALIGNPSVVLIDEFSTGIDAKMKRDMWITLRKVAVGKAVVITTHSMEEASALSNKVGIMSKRMLSVGTTAALSARYATYEVHFSCRSREDVDRAQRLMACIPGSRMADDVATRFEVPIKEENGLSLVELFHILSSQGDFSEYTVEKSTLESLFLKVIRENNVLEEDNPNRARVGRWCTFW